MTGNAPRRLRERKHRFDFRPGRDNDDRYITRHDYEGSRGYHVRIGTQVSLFFSTREYGGFRAARREAAAFRDEALRLLDLAEYEYRGNFTYGRNTTGYMGISVYNGAYVAQWTEKDGRRRKKWFSINKYGEKEALALAIAARDQAMGPYPHDILNMLEVLAASVRARRKA